MSVQQPEGTEEPEAIELPHGGDAFGALMDALAPEPEEPSTGETAGADGSAAPATPAGGADTGGGGDAAPGQAAAPDQGAAGAAGAEGAGDSAGDQGAAAGGAADDAASGGRGDLPAAWTAPAASVISKLGDLSNAFEENTSKAYQSAAYDAAREDYGGYFDALDKHPRMLVGTTVPKINGEGEEVLRDTNDAREWQEAVKSLLVEEIRDRASRQMDESKDFMDTVHASIDLFQKNADLIPGTKDFDVELANRFAELAQPYELRVEGKLQGYSIPVQPIIDQLRTKVAAERAAKPAAPAAPAAPAQTRKPAEPPQAGISSKAGTSSEKEDFSTLFGTIGLPGLQI